MGLTAVSGPSDPQPPSAAIDPELDAGTVVNDFVIETKLGKGAFGSVYKAHHPIAGKQVAIKVLARKHSFDPDIVERFIDEARAVNEIRHENIIDIFSFGVLDDGRHFFVMEYLDGEPLDALLEREGNLPLAEALPILRPIAKALDAAHQKGIAHRDLKPENIFLGRDEDGAVFPKLLDFGVAKLMAPEAREKRKTATGAPIGTPFYMSPEQCRGRDVDHRTDYYAFGVMTYQLLTGVYPFDGEDYMSILMQQISQMPDPPSSKNPALTAAVDKVVLRLMEKDPADRPPNLVTAVHELEDATGQRFDAPSVASPIGTSELPARRSFVAPWLALGAACAIALGIAVFAFLRSPEKHVPTPPAPGLASAPPPAPAPPAPPIVTPPPPPVSTPELATIHIVAPPHTEVRVGGKLVGVVPSIQLPRGAGEVTLELHADGYADATHAIVPDGEKRITVKLKKKAVPRRPPDSHSVEDPFRRSR